MGLLRTIARSAAEQAAYSQKAFARAQAGDRGYWFSPGATFEETVRAYQEQIQHWDHEQRVCDDLLARLANGTGDAVQVAA